MLCEDGTVRPIECNPRATSALHLYGPNDRIAEAILNGQSIGCTGSARRLVLPMWINLASHLFKKGHIGRWRKARKRSTSVEWNAFDPARLLQLISVIGFLGCRIEKQNFVDLALQPMNLSGTGNERRVNPFHPVGTPTSEVD